MVLWGEIVAVSYDAGWSFKIVKGINDKKNYVGETNYGGDSE